MILALGLAALAGVAVPASSITTRSALPSKLTVGDPFEVTYVVTSAHPSILTGPLADSLGPFLLVEEHRANAQRGERDESTYRMKVAAFRPGRWTLPALHFLVTHGQRSDTLTGDTVSVQVASVLPADMKDIRPLKPAEGFPNPWAWILPLAVVILGLLALFGRRLWERLRHSEALAPPPLPAWEEALAELDALPWREWLAAGQSKRFYYSLSEILKRYLERRFAFDAVEQTTTELLASMRAQRLPMREEITRFFARCDLVKYAKTEPPNEEWESAIAQVRDFVNRTRPAPEPATPATAPQPAVAGGTS